MIKGQSSGTNLGAYRAFTTSNGGHPPEFWVEDTLRQVVHVADSAPPPIREQALAFQDQVRAVLTAGIRNAIGSDRTTLVHHLNKAGMPEAAALIQSIRS